MSRNNKLVKFPQNGGNALEGLKKVGKSLKVVTGVDDALKHLGLANWINKVSKGRYREKMDNLINQGYGRKKRKLIK